MPLHLPTLARPEIRSKGYFGEKINSKRKKTINEEAKGTTASRGIL